MRGAGDWQALLTSLLSCLPALFLATKPGPTPNLIGKGLCVLNYVGLICVCRSMSSLWQTYILLRIPCYLFCLEEAHKINTVSHLGSGLETQDL